MSLESKSQEIFSLIEPRNKTQLKEYERYKELLKVTLPEEEFVLKCFLYYDWSRQVILQEIKKIEKSKVLDLVNFRVYVTAPRATVDYSVGNPYRQEGWFDGKSTFYQRACEVYHNIGYYLKS